MCAQCWSSATTVGLPAAVLAGRSAWARVRGRADRPGAVEQPVEEPRSPAPEPVAG